MDESLLNRPVNDGFSGGEKKRNEIFQMAVLEPTLAVLDETDSGLDIDALRIVADGVNALRAPDRAFLVITHYQRLLNYIVPDLVHVLVDGRIVRSGGKELALELEEKGYAALEEAARRDAAGAVARGADVDDRRRPLHRASTSSDLERAGASAGDEPAAVDRPAARRADALRASSASPPLRDEDWRFTNVAPLARARLRAAGAPAGQR